MSTYSNKLPTLNELIMFKHRTIREKDAAIARVTQTDMEKAAQIEKLNEQLASACTHAANILTFKPSHTG